MRREADSPGGALPILVLAMFLAPALGVPHEEMLQDTLKSIVVSFGALMAALVLAWSRRSGETPLLWHDALALPLLLMAYAIGSMAWSHPYLGGAEAVRWFVFALIAWVGLNTITPARLPLIAWGVHGGAVIASLWAALQFWFDLRLFPQGPHPASTFVNRNFFAEFAVCAMPFGFWLLANAKRRPMVALLAFSNAFVAVAIFMTGTRSALLAFWLLLLVALPLAAWRCRDQLALSGWTRGMSLMAAGIFVAATLGLGAIPSGDARIVEEGRGANALARGISRTQSIRPGDSSLGIRMIMWKATADVIRARPLTGVGAGAWESEIPLYQAEGSQLETDYYAHNEFLQLLAEYGVAGWAFLLGLLAWLVRSSWRAFRASSDAARAERPLQAMALASVAALFVVSNVGFPWRMAATGALFALCLGMLASADARISATSRGSARDLPPSPALARGVAFFAAACMALALYITWRAAESESKIVRATRMALTISQSGDYFNPKWIPVKREMLATLREGIELNRHYRKITPMVADELARWGDWTNAIWIWESVLESRPHVVAILCNVARGYASTGEPGKAMAYLSRARALQPNAPAVRSLEIILTSRSGDQVRALDMARSAIGQGIYDFDLLNAAFVLAWRAGDHPLALKAMELRMQNFPEYMAISLVQLGTFYQTEVRDTAKAMDAYRKGLAMATPREKAALAAQIPRELHETLGLTPPAVPAAQPPAQTSSSSR